MGFFGKVFMGTVAVILITAFVVYVSSLHALETQVQQETGLRVERECRLVAQTVEHAWVETAGTGDQTALLETAAALGESRVTLIATNGRALFDSHEDARAMGNQGDREEIRQTGKLVTRFSNTLKKEMIYYALPVEFKGQRVGYARVAVSIQDRDAQLSELNTAVRNGVLLAGLIALAFAALIARQISKPLQEIGEFVAEVGRGATPKRIPSGHALEIGRLAETVNTMAQELQGQIARIQRDKAEREAILSGIADGLIALDRDQRILFINSPARQLLSVPAGRVKGMLLSELCDNEAVASLLEQSAETDEAVHSETFVAGPDGERQVELSAVPLAGEGGRRRGSVLVLRDVTELRHLEAVRRDFVSNVSHELKTPLTAMRGYVEAVLDDEDMSTDQRVVFLQKARLNTERLTSIVSDLLSLSRLESEERELSFEPLEVREVLDAVLSDSMDLAESRQVRLELESDGSNPLARADETALHMAASNLVSNAIQYSPQETGHVRLRLTSTPEEVWIEVVDNGPGIPVDEQERIFERFYRIDKARSRKLGGTGLGLAIVRHVMAAHGGRVELESSPGQGSRFRLILSRFA